MNSRVWSVPCCSTSVSAIPASGMPEPSAQASSRRLRTLGAHAVSSGSTSRNRVTTGRMPRSSSRNAIAQVVRPPRSTVSTARKTRNASTRRTTAEMKPTIAAAPTQKIAQYRVWRHWLRRTSWSLAGGTGSAEVSTSSAVAAMRSARTVPRMSVTRRYPAVAKPSIASPRLVTTPLGKASTPIAKVIAAPATLASPSEAAVIHRARWISGSERVKMQRISRRAFSRASTGASYPALRPPRLS